MFTQDFRKLKLAGSAVGIAGLIYVGFSLGLLGLARWSELTMDAYPYRAEDWFRYHLATSFAHRDGEDILLTGPSAIRENLIYDQFDHSFRQRTRQGAISVATFDDVLLSLDYVEQRYGEDALPSVLVVGINPRFVANIPANVSPFVAAINRYCPEFRVEETDEGSRLVEKSGWEGMLAKRHFWSKQQPRFKAGLCSAGRVVMPDDAVYSEFGKDLPELNAFRRSLMFSRRDLPQAIDLVRRIGIRAAVGRWLQIYTLPYKYHYLEPRKPELFIRWMMEPESYWGDVYSWNPHDEEASIRERFARLLDFVERHDIELYLINTPEHEASRENYSSENYDAYLQILQDSIGETPLLDMREALPSNEFYDNVHATFDGALHLTDEVIRFIQETRAKSDADSSRRQPRDLHTTS